MAYAIRWVDHAREQREALPTEARHELDAALARLVADPRAYGSYSKREDQWTATFGAGWGVILYTIEDRWITITVLRITWVG